MKSFEEWLASQQVDASNQTPAELEGWKHAYAEVCARLGAGNDEDFRWLFCAFATKYYVTGRFAARAGLIPIHGNLLHHAVEMYLKAALVGPLTIKESKNKYSHGLPKLWARFKAEVVDPALERFDPTIAALHEFESIRYPDEVVAKGMTATVAWAPLDAVNVSGSAPMLPKYEVIIGDVDNLVIEVLKRASLNPKFFVIGLPVAAAREALAYQNPQAASWGL